MTIPAWLSEILLGFENDRRWDSVGEAINEGVRFLDYEEAAAQILGHIEQDRLKSFKNGYDQGRFDEAMEHSIKQDKKSDK